MTNNQGYFVIAVLLLILIAGGVYWYIVDHQARSGGPVPEADLVPNVVPAEEAKTTVSAEYIRSSSGASGTTLAWSAGAGASDCQILTYSSRPQGAEPIETTKVEVTGTLAVQDGYYYRLSCKGKEKTIRSDLDLLTL
jgi:hypothetical protein